MHSSFRIGHVGYSDHSVEVAFTTASGRVYVVETAFLADGSVDWTPLLSDIIGDGSVAYVRFASVSDAAFFRVRVQLTQ